MESQNSLFLSFLTLQPACCQQIVTWNLKTKLKQILGKNLWLSSAIWAKVFLSPGIFLDLKEIIRSKNLINRSNSQWNSEMFHVDKYPSLTVDQVSKLCSLNQVWFRHLKTKLFYLRTVDGDEDDKERLTAETRSVKCDVTNVREAALLLILKTLSATLFYQRVITPPAAPRVSSLTSQSQKHLDWQVTPPPAHLYMTELQGQNLTTKIYFEKEFLMRNT